MKRDDANRFVLISITVRVKRLQQSNHYEDESLRHHHHCQLLDFALLAKNKLDNLQSNQISVVDYYYHSPCYHYHQQ